MSKISFSTWLENCETCPLSEDECLGGTRCAYQIITKEIETDKITFEALKDTGQISVIFFNDINKERVPASQLRNIKNMETKHVLLSRRSYRNAKIYTKDIKHTDEFVYEIIEK